ncbi:MAG: O-antigen ligase family protein [Bacteroidetes bacterium]|nr:O-antigen ligase family protein [Bacteroidota bacterium]
MQSFDNSNRISGYINDLKSVLKDKSELTAWIAVMGVTLLIGYIHIYLGGKVQATFALLFIIIFVGISILRPSISVYALLFLAIAIEQAQLKYAWTYENPYHQNLNNMYWSLRGLSINPLELHICCILAGLFIRFVITREKWVPILAWKPLLLYCGALIFFIGLGLFRGGVGNVALWEVRGIGYLVILMVVVPQVIRTRRQVNHALWAIIAGVVFRAVEVSYHFVDSDFRLTGDGWGSHEDSGLFTTLLVYAAALWALKVHDTKQKTFLTVAALVLVLAIVGGERRSSYPILAAGLMLLPLLMPREVQKRLLRLSWKVGIVFALYLAVFWNSQSESILVGPARSIREGLAGDDENAAGDSYTSNLFRRVENYDLNRMFRMRPLLGTGYGMLIDYELPLPIGFELGFYIPHNQILGVAAKTGVIGFIIFMNFYISIISATTLGFRRLKHDKHMQAVLVFAAAAAIGHLIFSFFDIILTYYRPNVYVGGLFGLASAIVAMAKSESQPETITASPPGNGNTRVPVPWLLEMGEKEKAPVWSDR